jgi:general stress protein YciG
MGRKQGFAVMDPKLVRQISRKGGKAVHKQGKAHEWTKDTARIAGRKGGLASAKLRKERELQQREAERVAEQETET